LSFGEKRRKGACRELRGKKQISLKKKRGETEPKSRNKSNRKGDRELPRTILERKWFCFRCGGDGTSRKGVSRRAPSKREAHKKEDFPKKRPDSFAGEQ